MLRRANRTLLALAVGTMCAMPASAGDAQATAPIAAAPTSRGEVTQVVADTERFFREQTAAIARQLDRAARSDDHERVELLRKSFNELARRRAEAIASLNARFGPEEVEAARASASAALRAEADSRAAERPSWSDDRSDEERRPWSASILGPGGGQSGVGQAGGGLLRREIRLGSIGAGRSPSEVRASPNGTGRGPARSSTASKPKRPASKPNASDARSAANRNKPTNKPTSKPISSTSKSSSGNRGATGSRRSR